jgi:LPS O-antigen subunit length determinant protein (WzzB/FepE family)
MKNKHYFFIFFSLLFAISATSASPPDIDIVQETDSEWTDFFYIFISVIIGAVIFFILSVMKKPDDIF